MKLVLNLNFNPVKFNLSYLQEKEHIGNQEYFKAKIRFNGWKEVESFQLLQKEI